MRVFAFVLLFALAYAKHEQFIGWKSYFVHPASQSDLQAVRAIEHELELDFLSHPFIDREGVVLVKPEHQATFTQLLDDFGIKYRVHSEDVKKDLDIDDQKMDETRAQSRARNGGKNIPYDAYQELEVIYEYIDEVARNYPNLVTLVEPATSFEGRPMKYLKISSTNFADESKPVIVIDGGIHAREWVAPPTVTYAIHKLVENNTDPDLLNRFDWIILPVVNPDGYKFTFTSNRFWRKTRSTDQNSLSYLCPGVDGNRNYDFAFNTVGTSNNPCADTYAGSRAFSEVETRVVRDILDEYLHRTALYLTIHSYGSMILYPWGHDGSLSSNALALHVVGIAMADVIHNTQLPNFPDYIVGNSVHVIGYPAAGAAEDYAHSIGVPLSYTYELPGLSGGYEGFHLNPIYINQVVQETWNGISVGAKRAGDLYKGIIVP